MTAKDRPTSGGNSVRILHSSDWQIGMGRHFLSTEAQARFDDARLQAVERLFREAETRDCEAVVVAGDVFDDNLLNRRTWLQILDVLQAAPVPVFLLPGNHDPLNAASIYHQPELQALSPENGGKVTVLGDSEPRELRPGVKIIGAPLLSKVANEDLAYRAVAELEPAQDEIRVLVGHGQTESRESTADPATIDVDRLSELSQRRIVDYVALGDTHSAMTLDARQVVWYSGAPEVTDFLEPEGGGENNSGKALVVDIALDDAQPENSATVTVEEVQVGRWKFLALTEDVNSQEEIDAFLTKLQQIPEPRTTVIKYALKGSIDLLSDMKLDAALEEQTHRFAAFYPRSRLMDLQVVPELGELREVMQLRGYPELAMEDLLGRAEDPKESEETRNSAIDALKLLYRLAGIGAKDTEGARR